MKTRVGIAGTGFTGKGMAVAIQGQPDLEVSAVFTRSEVSSRVDHPFQSLLTHSLAAVLDCSDVIVECTGDVLHATTVIDAGLRAGLPVVTMDAEVQVTTGSYFSGKGLLSEAEGDQPGCLAALKEDAVQMGFQPIVYGNIKGFLNHTPTEQDMQYYAKRQGISMNMVVSFTDGTKLQVEQALAANGLGATIVAEGLTGLKVMAVGEAVESLAALADGAGEAISDYLLSATSPPGVFLVAAHSQYAEQRQALANFKMGSGPNYLLLRNYHLCHLEATKTIRRIVRGGGALLDNGATPRISVAAIAKRPLEPGDRILKGIGSFDVRGIAVKIAARPEHCPIGLIQNATVARHVEVGQMLSTDDVVLPDSLALEAWRSVRTRVLSGTMADGL